MDLLNQNGDVMGVPASETKGAEHREDGFDSGPGIRTPGDPNSDEERKKTGISRAEIDTSSPFGSVREAATRFGGIGFWRPAAAHHGSDSQVTNDMAKMEMEAAELERDFVAKERETHAILEELESTMTTKEQLKAKLQHEEEDEDRTVVREAGKKSNGLTMCPSSAPGLILMELKQAKLNLGRTTHDLVDIRAAVESYKERIEKERILVEKTKKRVVSNSMKASALEQELNRYGKENDAFKVTWWDLQKLSSETEQLKKARDAAKSEALRAVCGIEQIKAKIKTVESRLVAARKIKEAARATEAAALADINALNKSERNPEEGIVILTLEEYSMLASRAREAEETCKRRVVGAELLVDEATNVLKTEILNKVEKATNEMKLRKEALEKALSRLESANRDKLEMEEAMRRWRSGHGQRKSSVQNSTKFKNSTLVNEDDSPFKAFKSTLSIGQILSRKLLSNEDYENQMCTAKKSNGKQRASLSHLLCKSSSVFSLGEEKENARKLGTPRRKKKKKFGLFRISLVRKQGKNVTSN
ncbi:hypothetical protein DM860_016531 [Cuscuta australis]|uniref:WEB family protein n=1 Tax=Cuscuta australis TaxID=267555 RepID=A0A328E6E1_9ASTE|nr:hypothetical protein DM860_016531 [Cuscuta australis]